MKRILVLAMAAMISAGVYANEPSAVNEKVLKSFKETFTSAKQVKWYEADDNYSVRFFQGETRYIVYYSKQGKITGSMKFYEPAALPVPVLNDLKRQYSDMKTHSVTEISSGADTAYFVKMEDTKYWYTIRFNNYGENDIYERVKKQ